MCNCCPTVMNSDLINTRKTGLFLIFEDVTFSQNNNCKDKATDRLTIKQNKASFHHGDTVYFVDVHNKSKREWFMDKLKYFFFLALKNNIQKVEQEPGGVPESRVRSEPKNNVELLAKTRTRT